MRTDDLSRLLPELESVSKAMIDAIAEWEGTDFDAVLGKLTSEASSVGRSWSGSSLGYHATVYYEGFRVPPPGRHFSIDWGLMGIGDTTGDWVECQYDAVTAHIEEAAGSPYLAEARTRSQVLRTLFEGAHRTIASILDVALATAPDSYLQDAKERLEKLVVYTATQIVRAGLPKQYVSRDQLAISQGLRYAPHLVVEAEVAALRAPAITGKQLIKLVSEISAHIVRRRSVALVIEAPPETAPRVAPSPTCDLLLVTVTEVETRAVMAAMCAIAGDPTISFGGTKTYFKFGAVEGTNVVLVRSEMGSDTIGGSATTIRDALTEVAPKAVIMVGIAFGVDETKHPVGTVLVSQQLHAYELQRVGTRQDGDVTIRPRGDRVTASAKLLDRFRTASLSWTGNAQFGLLLSGQKLVDNVDFRSQLLEHEPEAIGGEMEGVGLYAATAGKADWIVVKAICDYADGNKRESKMERQRTAAESAAALVAFTLAQGGLRAGQE